MSNTIERPRNCGECARMQRFCAGVGGISCHPLVVVEVEDIGGVVSDLCDVRNSDVCRPNVGVRKEVGE